MSGSFLFKGEMVRGILNTRQGVWSAESIDPERPFKWQTRRIVKPQPVDGLEWNGWLLDTTGDRSKIGSATWYDAQVGSHYAKPKNGRPGDVAWVRETWATEDVLDSYAPNELGNAAYVPLWYRADGPTIDVTVVRGKWHPSIHMPRWASRLDLLIKVVRVERLQDISDADAIAEGIERLEGSHMWKHCDYIDGCACFGTDSPMASFAKLWDSINGRPKPSKSNPYTGQREECFVSYPWAGERFTERRRGKTHYVVGNPWVFVYEFMRMGEGAQ